MRAALAYLCEYLLALLLCLVFVLALALAPICMLSAFLGFVFDTDIGQIRAALLAVTAGACVLFITRSAMRGEELL